jgi:hypothetical protein
MPAMARVIRLVTVADLDEASARRISVSARHEAVLDDGRRVVLLNDRGWSETLHGAGAQEISSIWTTTSEQAIARTARMVVGPDEAYGNRTQEDMDAGHWTTLAETLGGHGVAVGPDELRRLPHDVELGDRLRMAIEHR